MPSFTMAKLIDGRAIAEKVYVDLRGDIAELVARGVTPGLAVVLVGDNPASRAYVRSKDKMCRELGLHSVKLELPASITQTELLRRVEELNRDSSIHGILVQSPLPEVMGPDAERRVFDAISPEKDVDGLHPVNVGRLVQNRAALVACTPSGIVELLERSHIAIGGARAAVIGRSDIVGKPMALLLLHANATVTICHSKTTNLAAEAQRADILVAAIGKPGLVTGDFIKPGATVIDVGMNRVAAETPGKTRFVGDVNPDHVREIASAYTPVPGGVGPLTIAMLMSNTVAAAERHLCSA